jgi:hypothetical protein
VFVFRLVYEAVGGINKQMQSQKTPEVQSKLSTAAIARLDNAAEELLSSRIYPRHRTFQAVTEAWERLLPPELQRHCRIANISSGQLKVFADSPSYVHELRIISTELLAGIRQQCPRVKLRSIKAVLDSGSPSIEPDS